MASVLHRYLNYVYQDMVRKRLAAQLDLVQLPATQVYLDLGCAVGYNTARVQKILKPQKTLALEYDPQAAQVVLARGIPVICHDLNQPLPLCSASVDVITVLDVLEHLVETWRFLTEVYRVLKPGGVVLIDSPNLAAWHNILGLMLGVQPSSGPHLVSIADSDWGLVEDMHRRDHQLTGQSAETVVNSKMHRHIVIPAYRSLRRVLQKAGFEVLACRGFGYYPLPPPLSDWMCRLDISHAHHYLIKARKPLRGMPLAVLS